MYDLDDPEVQQNFAHRYIHNLLEADEQVAFEEYLMEHPKLIDAIETDKLLARGLSLVETTTSKQTGIQRSSWLGWLLAGASVAYLSMFAIGSLPLQTKQLDGIDRVVYIDDIRSADPVQKRILLSSRSEKMVLMLSTDLGQAGPFNIKISQLDSGDLVAETKNAKQTETNDIVILLNTELFIFENLMNTE